MLTPPVASSSPTDVTDCRRLCVASCFLVVHQYIQSCNTTPPSSPSLSPDQYRDIAVSIVDYYLFSQVHLGCTDLLGMDCPPQRLFGSGGFIEEKNKKNCYTVWGEKEFHQWQVLYYLKYFAWWVEAGNILSVLLLSSSPMKRQPNWLNGHVLISFVLTLLSKNEITARQVILSQSHSDSTLHKY